MDHLDIRDIRKLCEISDPLAPIFCPKTMKVVLDELDRTEEAYKTARNWILAFESESKDPVIE